MFNKKQILITILSIILTTVFVVIPSVGAADWFFAYTQAPKNFTCTPNRVFSNDGAISYSLPNTASITTNEYINGSNYATKTNGLSGNGKQNFPVVSSIFSTQSFPYTYAVSYTVKADGETISKSSLTIKCINAETATLVVSNISYSSDAEDANVVYPPDNRLNWQSGDSHVAIVYVDATGIGLYLYETDSYVTNFVTEDDIADYVDNLPSENTLIASAGAVDVYMLTTGEIQFNMTDAEGKNFALIMSDLNGSDAYGYSF